MTNKEKYRILCDKEPSIPIFMRDWWLDAVCENTDYWDVILYEEGGRIVAAHPYYLHNKYCFKVVIPPVLTPIGGAWISYEKGMTKTTRYSFEIKIMKYFAKKIDELRIDWYTQNFSENIRNWLGFYWEGFNQTTRYKYVIDNLSDLDSVYSGFKSETKRNLRVAQKNLVISKDTLEADFYSIIKLTFQKQGLRVPFSEEYISRIINVAIKKDSCKIFSAKDEEGNLHAALMVVFDKDTCYGLMPAADSKYANTAAPTLLVWEAICFASEKGIQKYDFLGSMIEPIEKFFRHFGATQTPYFAIEKKYSKFYSFLKSIKK